jgi:hypothetical protein
MSPADLKQIFFHCHHKDINGFYANDVDIIEYGQKVAAYALAQKKPMSEDQVLDFMLKVELPSQEDLLERVKALVRAVEEFHGIK